MSDYNVHRLKPLLWTECILSFESVSSFDYIGDSVSQKIILNMLVRKNNTFEIQ